MTLDKILKKTILPLALSSSIVGCSSLPVRDLDVEMVDNQYILNQSKGQEIFNKNPTLYQQFWIDLANSRETPLQVSSKFYMTGKFDTLKKDLDKYSSKELNSFAVSYMIAEANKFRQNYLEMAKKKDIVAGAVTAAILCAVICPEASGKAATSNGSSGYGPSTPGNTRIYTPIVPNGG